MLRVICIKKCNEYYGELSYWYSPEVGDELVVINSEKRYGRLFYDLEGYPEFLYDSKYFATLPDADARRRCPTRCRRKKKQLLILKPNWYEL
jgi:hypothetical protein